MYIQWKINRLDWEDEPDPQLANCLLQIEGRIECGGRTAGIVDAHYLCADEPDSDNAFLEFWDLDATTCEVFEEIMDRDHFQFRYPIPWHMEFATGILCVHFIALRPEFRGIGMGRAVMRELVRTCADPRTGVVLLDVRPLQHRPHGYDDFDEEVRDLPWNPPAEDQQRLIRHFETWGMEPLPDTRFMVAPPAFLSESRATKWPPVPVRDHRNTCVLCGTWIDENAGDLRETPDGPIHKHCE